MDHLTLQENIDPEEGLIDYDDDSGVFDDVNFIIRNNIWQNTTVRDGDKYIRKGKLDKIYKQICEFIPEDSLSKKEFKKTMQGCFSEEDDLHEDLYFCNFKETRNIPRQLVNIIDQNLSNN